MELPSINIPGDVTYIGPSAFENCFKLANVTLPSSVGYIGSGAFASCDSFTSFDIPENVTTIYGGTFQGCDKLAVVSIPEGVTAIGFWAFYECPSLSNIIIPSTVTSIDDQAFLDCPGLTSITVLATYPPEDVSERTFENTNECPIFVPAESLEAYKTAEGWSNYVSRIHTIGSPDGKIQDHDYVDMGKGLKWATTNVDADSPDGPGSLFAWGRTEPITLPIDASISVESFVDTASELWGDRWRMPTIEEWDVLKDDDYYHWTWDVERKGYVVESLIPGYEGNSIFLPAAGATGEQALSGVGTEGFYWSSTPNTSESNSSSCLWFSQGSIYTGGYFRGAGLSVRPVSD